MEKSGGEVIAFTNRGATSLSWDALRLSNATRAAGEALNDCFAECRRFDDVGRAEARLAEDAAELGNILTALSKDLLALRSRYL